MAVLQRNGDFRTWRAILTNHGGDDLMTAIHPPFLHRF
jgi:hypothetical protein